MKNGRIVLSYTVYPRTNEHTALEYKPATSGDAKTLLCFSSIFSSPESGRKHMVGTYATHPPVQETNSELDLAPQLPTDHSDSHNYHAGNAAHTETHLV